MQRRRQATVFFKWLCVCIRSFLCFHESEETHRLTYMFCPLWHAFTWWYAPLDAVQACGSTQGNHCVCRGTYSLGPSPQPKVGHYNALPDRRLQLPVQSQQ